MSEQRWAVLGTETMNGWLVVHPGDVIRASDGRLECWAVHSRHHTWEEAMQEADRMARTGTFTLPTPKAVHTIPAAVPDEHPIYVHTEGQLTEISAVASQGRMRINLYRAELEPVALVLLAHARRRA